MAKQVKSVGELDRISSLPDPILCHILSFLPTKDAVRSSVVSPRWRYLFASMPTLDFQYCLSSIYSRPGAENFKNFVDRLLFFPNHITLECFRLYECSSRDVDYLSLYGRLYGWICAALWRGVKEIDIRHRDLPVLPTLLFTSQSLMTLKLNMYEDMKVPCKVCLPNLKSLHLRNVRFVDGDSIHRLISGCLALEDLVLYLPELPKNIGKINIHSLSLKRLTLDFEMIFNINPFGFNYTFVINAPNLVCFKYVGLIAGGYCLSTMNSLEKAIIEVYRLDDEPSYDVNRESGATLLQGICSVKSLHLTIEQPETLIRMPPEPVLGFHKLLELKLKIRNEYHDWQGAWVFQFLRCAPNLETLHLDLVVPYGGFKPVPEEVPSCLLFHLNEIKIEFFEGNEHMFEMISYFLNHASVLEMLMIEAIGFEEDEELSIVKKLLGFPRISKKCRVVVL
ncbi:hypothetical protein like AT3G59200 [Hibiscus trionum]|uniref:F-box domain-containing protein n=1 Tax=Hibiscus trionum TaxID=183268 RepID=A0A9W7M2L5_HIBTR|nr:hypothetical protein like AT3G59200 [Hibiscus trionum]